MPFGLPRTCQDVGGMSPLGRAPLAVSGERDVTGRGDPGKVRTAGWDGCTASSRGSGFCRLVLVLIQLF